MLELWKSVLHSLDDERTRVAQSLALVRNLPVIALCNATAAACALWQSPGLGHTERLLWMAGLSLLLWPIVRSWLRLRSAPSPQRVSRSRIVNVIAHSGLLGLVWSGILIACARAPNGSNDFLLACGVFISIGAVASTFYIPLACMAYALPVVATGVALALVAQAPQASPFLVSTVVAGAVAGHCLWVNWSNFRNVVQLAAEKDALLDRLAEQVERQDELLRARHEAQAALQAANAMLRTLAGTDALTGLANRRSFDEALESAWLACRKSARPLSVLLLDADHFKRLNDRFGHQVGDDCLRMIGAELGIALRAPEMAARLGGEEFAVLLPGADAGRAKAVADAIRERVAAAGDEYRLTLSVGLATTYPEEGLETGAILVARADHALYEAKKRGRNQTALAA